MKWIWVLFFFIFASVSQKFRLLRQKKALTSDTFIYQPYTVSVNFTDPHGRDNHLNVALDTNTKYFFVFCCKNNNGRENCYNNTICQRVCRRKYDGPCQRWFKFFNVYHTNAHGAEGNYNSTSDKVSTVNITNFSIGNENFEKSIMEIDYSGHPLFNYTEGVIGLTYSFFNDSFNSIFYRAHPKGTRKLAFDFYLPHKKEEFSLNEDGHMIVGGSNVNEYVKNIWFGNKSILWSDIDYNYNRKIFEEYYHKETLTNQYISSRFSSSYTLNYVFTIYDFSICNASIHSELGVNWNVIIDTRIDGIAVPYEFYTIIERWIIWDNVSDSLPNLSFKMRPDGPSLYYPMNLLYDNSTGGNYIHLYNANSLREILYQLTISGEPYIRFGTRVMQHFMTIIDVDTRRVGLIQKESVSDDVNFCAKRKDCVGETIYHETLNVCLPPRCDLYMFQDYFEDGRCGVRYDFAGVLFILILMYVVIDVVVGEVYFFWIRSFKSHKKNPIVG